MLGQTFPVAGVFDDGLVTGVGHTVQGAATQAESIRPVAPRPARGNPSLFKNQRLGAAFRKSPGPLTNGVGVPFQRARHRRRFPTLRQQPHGVPTFSFPRHRCPIHPPSHLNLIRLPSLRQRPHVLPAHDNLRQISLPTTSIQDNSTQRRCGFHLGFSLVWVLLCPPVALQWYDRVDAQIPGLGDDFVGVVGFLRQLLSVPVWTSAKGFGRSGVCGVHASLGCPSRSAAENHTDQIHERQKNTDVRVRNYQAGIINSYRISYEIYR